MKTFDCIPYLSPKDEHSKPTKACVNSQYIGWCSVDALWLLRHRTEWLHPLGCSKTLLLCPDLSVKLSLDGSGQPAKEQL